MTDQTDAIKGEYVQLKYSPSRKVVQIWIDLDISEGPRVTEILGAPGEGVWVAIARLARDAGAAVPVIRPPSGSAKVADSAPIVQHLEFDNSKNTSTVESKPKRPFCELRPSEQAGILCNDAGFQRWLGASDEQTAINTVRRRCKVSSRKEFDTDTFKAAGWKNMLVNWETASGRTAEDRG